MKGFERRKDWSDELCNIYNMRNFKQDCVREFIENFPERPHITDIRNPLGLNPYIKVNQIRTPFQFLRFRIHEYHKSILHYSEEYSFDAINYQNYIPYGIIKKGFTYNVTCRAYGELGFSEVSNTYNLDLWHPPAPTIPPCEGQDVYELECEYNICCEDTFVC